VTAALAIWPLSWIEHRRSVRPSTLLNIYLLCALIFDIPLCRTLYLRGDTAAFIAPVFVAGTGMKLGLLILEAQSKTSCLKDPYSKLSPEARAGVLNRIIFWWINTLLIAGYKRVVVYNDLPVLDSELSSECVQPGMQAAWDERGKPDESSTLYSTSDLIVKSHSAYVLLLAVLKYLQWPLLSVLFPRICLIVLKYAQPFLISSAIHFVSEVDYKTENSVTASRLIAAAIFIYTGIAVGYLLSTLHRQHC
jgi:ATP-binding cassette, subfamily C (CFTR/MRP), member 1